MQVKSAWPRPLQGTDVTGGLSKPPHCNLHGFPLGFYPLLHGFCSVYTAGGRGTECVFPLLPSPAVWASPPPSFPRFPPPPWTSSSAWHSLPLSGWAIPPWTRPRESVPSFVWPLLLLLGIDAALRAGLRPLRAQVPLATPRELCFGSKRSYPGS